MEARQREGVRLLDQRQEEERRYLSRGLHDGLGQHCVALLLGLRCLRDEVPDRQARIDELTSLVERIGCEVHALALQLRPTSLDDNGLSGALAALLDAWSQRTGIIPELHLSGVDRDRLPPDIEVVLYRIAQEALSNVMAHASARGLSLIVDRREGEVRMVVEDDGRGFDAQAVSDAGADLGLRSMKERAAQFGGTVAFESAAGCGTSVFVRIPLPAV